MIRRYFFKLVSAASVLLCVAIALLWLRSMTTCDLVMRPAPWTLINAISLRGRVHVQYVVSDRKMPLLTTWDWQSQPANGAILADDPGWHLGGFGGSRRTMNANPTILKSYIGIVPYWALILCAGAFAAGTYQLAKRQRRAGAVRRGSCPHCDYNLTANTSGVCPECGTAVAGEGKMIA